MTSSRALACLFGSVLLFASLAASQDENSRVVRQRASSPLAPRMNGVTESRQQQLRDRSQSPLRLGTAFKHRYNEKLHESLWSTETTGDFYCTVLADQAYGCMDESAPSISGSACALISADGPFAIVNPGDTTVTAQCGIDNNGTFQGYADVGSKSTQFVSGYTTITATCVIATMNCIGTINADFDAYESSDDEGDFGPLIGEVSFSGTSTAVGMTIGTDPDTGLYGVLEIDANYDGPGQEWIAEPLPTINNPSVPSASFPGSAGFDLTVNGSDFFSDSTVEWNGSPLSTIFLNSSQLRASVSSQDVASAGTATVTVSNNTGSSNAAYFSSTQPTSTVTLVATQNSVATQPEGVAMSDFNGDGRLDLAAVSFGGFVSIMLGNGDGTFRGHVDYSVGAGSRAIVVGDFNGDGIPDIATVNESANTVSILLGNGNGTFRNHVDYSVGSSPFAVTAADFNGDGVLDLAVVNQSDNTVSILSGNGDGTFQPWTLCATGQLPFGIAAGDFNRDGNPDLAVANFNDNTVSILLGQGNGAFSSSVVYATSASPEMLAVADLNGDGNLDLAIGTNQAKEPQFSILLGKGDGTFLPHYEYPAGSKPRAVIAADFNGDGQVDLAFANYGNNSVSILLGQGNGTFGSPTGYPTGTSPQSIVAGDFANNGRMDVATADLGSGTVSLLLQTPVVLLSPSSLNFGVQAIGTTSPPQNISLSNSGSAPLSITNFAMQGDFAQTNTCNDTVEPGNGCNISVTFTPTAGGTRTGNLAIADNGEFSPQTVPLSGTGLTATSVTLSSSLDPSKYGQSVTFSAVVVPSGPGVPTGNVSFYDGGTLLGSVSLTKSVAPFTTSSLTGGSHSITASYAGDGTFGPSSSPVLTQAVSKIPPSINLSSAPNPSYVNQMVTLSAIAAGVNQAKPTGSITFKEGALVLGTVLLSNGQASFTEAFSKPSNYTILAIYSGDQNYLSKTSKADKQVVQKYATTTALASSPNPASHGQPVTFTASVATVGPVASGKVTFKNGGKSLGTASVINGVAMITKSNLPTGSLSITAIYSGDSECSGSTSPVLVQIID